MSGNIDPTYEPEHFGALNAVQEADNRFIPEGFENIVDFEINWLVQKYNAEYGLNPERSLIFFNDIRQQIENILENGYIIDSRGNLALQTVEGLDEGQLNAIGNRIEACPFLTTYEKALNAGISFNERPEKSPKNVLFLWKDKISKLHYSLSLGSGVTFQCGTKIGPTLIPEHGMSTISELVSSLHFYVYDCCAQNPDFKRFLKRELFLIPSSLVAACLINYSNNYGGGCLADARKNKQKYRGREIS